MVADSTNKEAIKAFALQLIEHIGQSENVVIVLDNHSSHRSLETQAVFKAHKMELLFLPPYSSHLNPVELMWAWIKRKWRQFNMGYPDVDEVDRQREIKQICNETYQINLRNIVNSNKFHLLKIIEDMK